MNTSDEILYEWEAKYYSIWITVTFLTLENTLVQNIIF